MLMCMNEIIGGCTFECFIMFYIWLMFIVMFDLYYNVYVEMMCYFYNIIMDGDYFVVIDFWVGMGFNVDFFVFMYEWNIWDVCFDFNCYYVNGIKFIFCFYFWFGYF